MTALPQGRRRDRYYGLGFVTDALLHLPFEGGVPYETDFSVDTNGHLGQKATVTGGVIGRPGKFGKAVQVAEAVTNMVLNPVGGGASSIAAIGAATVTTQSTTKKYIWSTSTKLVTTAAANDGIDYTLSALTNAIHYVTIRIDVVWDTQEWSLDGTTYNAPTLLSSDDDGWYVYGFSFPAAQANGSTSLKIRQTDATIRTLYIGHVQAEAKAYPTPPCHGSLGTGHAWTGTAHNSTSTRTAALLTYPTVGNINASQGSVTAWIKAYLNDDIGVILDADGTYDFFFFRTSTDIVRFRYGTSAGTTTLEGGTIADNQWQHACCTWDENGAALYLDGVLVDSSAVAADIALNPIMQIGRERGSDRRYFNGYIDDFAILDRALTADEVKAIYDSGNPLVVPGGYYYGA